MMLESQQKSVHNQQTLTMAGDATMPVDSRASGPETGPREPVRPGPRATRRESGPQRRERILDLMRVNGFQSVTQLVELLDVSDMTIRRDLRRLAELGEVRVVHGGASLPHATLRAADFTRRGQHKQAAKQRIGLAALATVGPHATIGIDAGTTTFEIAAALPATFTGTVISHSVPVLQHMRTYAGARVIGLGGELLAWSQAFVGSAAVNALAELHADTVFVGAAAIGASGLFVATDRERPTKLALMSSTDRVVLLADRTKFSAAAPVRLCPWDEVDVLVTDAEPPAAIARSCAAAQVQIIVAGADPAESQ